MHRAARHGALHVLRARGSAVRRSDFRRCGSGSDGGWCSGSERKRAPRDPGRVEMGVRQMQLHRGHCAGPLRRGGRRDARVDQAADLAVVVGMTRCRLARSVVRRRVQVLALRRDRCRRIDERRQPHGHDVERQQQCGCETLSVHPRPGKSPSRMSPAVGNGTAMQRARQGPRFPVRALRRTTGPR